MAAVLALALINGPAVLVQLLSTPAERTEVGQFTAALVVARLPFFLFQAIQAALLPKLSGLVAEARYDEFRRGLRRLVADRGRAGRAGHHRRVHRGLPGDDPACSVPATRSATARWALLAAACGAYVVATAVAQALIALGGLRRVAVGWGIGCAVMLAMLPFGTDPVARVENAFLAGALASIVAMVVELRAPVTFGRGGLAGGGAGGYDRSATRAVTTKV